VKVIREEEGIAELLSLGEKLERERREENEENVEERLI
jgi:hypothetical protein